MRKKGKKYIFKENELRHLINLCAINEGYVGRGTMNENNTVQQPGVAQQTGVAVGTGIGNVAQQQGGNVKQQPQTGTSQQMGSMVGRIPGEMITPEMIQKAKQEAGMLMNGQANPQDPKIRSYIEKILGGTPLWGILSMMFGWNNDKTDADWEATYGAGEAYNGKGGGSLDIMFSGSYQDWMNGDGKNHPSSSFAKSVIISPNCTQRKNKITKITIHHMASVGDAESVGQQFKQPGRRASSNYGIGHDGEIVLYVPEDYAAWTSNSSWNDQQAVTIEVSNCPPNEPISHQPHTKPNQAWNWPIGDAAFNSLIALCRDICRRNGITPRYTGDPGGTFTTHKMFASTECPGDYLEEMLRSGDLLKELTSSMPNTSSEQEQLLQTMQTLRYKR